MFHIGDHRITKGLLCTLLRMVTSRLVTRQAHMPCSASSLRFWKERHLPMLWLRKSWIAHDFSICRPKGQSCNIIYATRSSSFIIHHFWAKIRQHHLTSSFLYLLKHPFTSAWNCLDPATVAWIHHTKSVLKWMVSLEFLVTKSSTSAWREI